MDGGINLSLESSSVFKKSNGRKLKTSWCIANGITTKFSKFTRWRSKLVNGNK